ncbi:MAG: V-type ATPase subunit [archaeon]
MRAEGGKWSSYALVTPIIESRKLRTLKREHAAVIAGASEISDAIAGMGSTDLGIFLNEIYHENLCANDLELPLWQFLAKEVSFLYEKIPNEAGIVLDAYLNKYDVTNIKATIRKILSTFTDGIGVPLGFVSRNDKLKELLKCNSLDEISVVLDSLSMTGYAAVTRRTTDRLTLEGELEDEYCSGLLRTGERSGDPHVQRFFGEMVDLTNTLSFLRCIGQNKSITTHQLFGQTYRLSSNDIQALLSCTSVENALTVLEKTHYHRLAVRLMDAYVRTHSTLLLESLTSEYLDHLSYDEFLVSVFTPGHILSYILCKEREVHTALLILKFVEEQLHHDTYARWLSGEMV